MIRIAFGHQARTGKDTACEYLQKKYGGEISHFSDPLYDILNYAQLVCEFPMKKDREFLQWVGTEWARKKDPDVWVNYFIKNLDRTCNNFVADIRFPNELSTLKNEGFVCVKIVRNDVEQLSHISELILSEHDGWDYTIENNGSIEEFHQKLDQLISQAFSSTNIPGSSVDAITA